MRKEKRNNVNYYTKRYTKYNMGINSFNYYNYILYIQICRKKERKKVEKEEFKDLIDSLNIAEIVSFEIIYRKEKNYGLYYNSSAVKQTISYGKEE